MSTAWQAGPTRLFKLQIGMIFVLWLAGAVAAMAAPLQLKQPLHDWLSQHPSVRYAPEADYGPFVYVEKEGVPLGMSVDFLKLISSKTGLQFQALPAHPLSENLELARQGRVEVITSLRPTPERARFLAFTSPYVSIPAVLVVKKPASQQTTLAQMQGKKVAVGKGYAVEAHVRQHYPNVVWVALASDSLGLSQLMDGQVDAVVADAASVHFSATAEQKARIRIAAPVGFDYPLSFAYRKDMPELGQILQAGLQAISLAEREPIMQRWMPENADAGQSEANRLWLWLALALLAAAVIGAVLRRNSRS